MTSFLKQHNQQPQGPHQVEFSVQGRHQEVGKREQKDGYGSPHFPVGALVSGAGTGMGGMGAHLSIISKIKEALETRGLGTSSTVRQT